MATRVKKKTEAIARAIADAPVTRVPLRNLHLDPKNPRLPSNVPRRDREILNYIAENTAIEDLANAIATNDFFPGEPLVVVPAPEHGTDHYTVVEGNRRLTALRLLQNPDDIRAPSTRLRSIAENAAHAPTSIPVVIRTSRDEVLPYLGFRHITGVKAWEPLAKARYMRQLMEMLSDKREKPETRYREVAEAIGSRPTNVKRNLDALAVYELMERSNFFEIPDLDENTIKFGLLYTALGDENIALYAGLARDDDTGAPTHPIFHPNVLNRAHIRELVGWIFRKNADGETVLGESRNISRLGAVVAHAAATKAIRTGSSLEYAYQLTTGIVSEFNSLLYSAEQTLRSAAGLVVTIPYDGQAAALAERLHAYTTQILNSLASRRGAPTSTATPRKATSEPKSKRSRR